MGDRHINYICYWDLNASIIVGKHARTQMVNVAFARMLNRLIHRRMGRKTIFLLPLFFFSSLVYLNRSRTVTMSGGRACMCAPNSFLQSVWYTMKRVHTIHVICYRPQASIILCMAWPGVYDCTFSFDYIVFKLSLAHTHSRAVAPSVALFSVFTALPSTAVRASERIMCVCITDLHWYILINLE